MLPDGPGSRAPSNRAHANSTSQRGGLPDGVGHLPTSIVLAHSVLIMSLDAPGAFVTRQKDARWPEESIDARGYVGSVDWSSASRAGKNQPILLTNVAKPGAVTAPRQLETRVHMTSLEHANAPLPHTLVKLTFPIFSALVSDHDVEEPGTHNATTCMHDKCAHKGQEQGMCGRHQETGTIGKWRVHIVQPWLRKSPAAVHKQSQSRCV